MVMTEERVSLKAEKPRRKQTNLSSGSVAQRAASSCIASTVPQTCTGVYCSTSSQQSKLGRAYLEEDVNDLRSKRHYRRRREPVSSQILEETNCERVRRTYDEQVDRVDAPPRPLANLVDADGLVRTGTLINCKTSRFRVARGEIPFFELNSMSSLSS